MDIYMDVSWVLINKLNEVFSVVHTNYYFIIILANKLLNSNTNLFFYSLVYVLIKELSNNQINNTNDINALYSS